MKKLLLPLLILLAASCAPEPGSVAWCEDMDEKPKGDWTTNEATEYATSCIFRSDEDEEN